VISVSERQDLLKLQEVNNFFQLPYVLPSFFGKLQVFEKTVCGLDDKQGLQAFAVSEGAEGLKRLQFFRRVGFFKGLERGGVWNLESEGDALMECHLSIEQTYGFGFTEAESFKYLDRAFLQVNIYTGVDAV
jgi:hypothetical protein